jgi:hypothetical protein
MPIFPDSQFADPSQYAMAWDSVIEILTLVVIFAFAVERVLAQIFETPIFIKIEEGLRGGAKKKYITSQSAVSKEYGNARYSGNGESSLKPIIASVFGILLACLYKIDLFSIVAGWAGVSFFGCAMTGLVIAGGSKASIKLFHDVFNVKSSAYERYKNGKSFTVQRPTPDTLIEEAIS